ncbi:MAG: YqgE/AlgH family protein [Polyangiaceae bacterium]|nr:YqgE/AlgH family protein [Polyangiaceae bacterium]
MSVLAPGMLVAAPPLGDPNFDRSVVLLAAHGPDGAFGWVVNGREVMSMPELLVRADVTESAITVPGLVRVGGPVAQEQVWLIYRSEERFTDVEGQFDVGSGITACASRKALEAVAKGHAPGSLMGLIGYAGWAPDQLENEIRAGAWLPVDLDPAVVFDVENADVWTQAYRRAGTSPIAFTTRTVGSA